MVSLAYSGVTKELPRPESGTVHILDSRNTASLGQRRCRTSNRQERLATSKTDVEHPHPPFSPPPNRQERLATGRAGAQPPTDKSGQLTAQVYLKARPDRQCTNSGIANHLHHLHESIITISIMCPASWRRSSCLPRRLWSLVFWINSIESIPPCHCLGPPPASFNPIYLHLFYCWSFGKFYQDLVPFSSAKLRVFVNVCVF